MNKIGYPHLLLTGYGIWFLILAIAPHQRGFWLAANISPALVCLFFIMGYRRFRFSNLSYTLAAFFLFFQTLGAHYFFYRVPFDWITNLFDFSRNNFDRMVHVSVGFYAFLIAEWIQKKVIPRGPLIYLFAFSIIMTVAGIWEVFEWLFVILIVPDGNSDLLGAQGDIWDAQKDMMADASGAIIILILFYFIRGRKDE